jgi:hypothetical protein
LPIQPDRFNLPNLNAAREENVPGGPPEVFCSNANNAQPVNGKK